MLLGNLFHKTHIEKLDLVKSKKIFIIYSNLYTLLNTYKSKIDENNDDWDKMKKIGNPNELIHICLNRDKVNHSVAKYLPLSRSYFKMWEILKDFNIFENQLLNLNIACLAEGPGGFMEAINNLHSDYDDNIYGLTLDSENKYIPGWKKIEDNKKNKKYKLCYGNLYNLQDIKRFIKNFEDEKAYLVTADGGFDYSVDFNNQEKLSYQIIFCEIVTNLAIQKKGGIFVCKIFDIFTSFTLKIIYLLYCLYDEIYLVKPQTSRLANSEKYLVAKGFNGINTELLDNLYDMVDEWTDDIIDVEGINLDPNFLKYMFEYNKIFVNRQIYYLNHTVNLINNKPSKEKYQEIIRQQVRNAIDWCKKYNLDINTKSRYLKYIKSY